MEGTMTSIADLIRKLRSHENKRVLEAVEELRVRGWLSDGSLNTVPLCHVHMERADLIGAKLNNVDLHQADFRWADLSMADLSGCDLSRVRFQEANLSAANLAGADLYKANLQGARNLTDEQLAQAKRLYGAIMPDGSAYDGCYNLSGDLQFAQWGKVDPQDAQAMAEFLGVPLEVYLQGQQRKVVSLRGV
jgi:uncharacterized protein YjbI with pentapeptide repeats